MVNITQNYKAFLNEQKNTEVNITLLNKLSKKIEAESILINKNFQEISEDYSNYSIGNLTLLYVYFLRLVRNAPTTSD